MTKLTDEEKALFAQAMADVNPIHPSTQKVSIQSDKKQPPLVRKKRTPQSANISTKELFEEPAEKVSAHESLFFQRYAMSKSDLKALKSGSFRYNWTIDLHGYTELEAEKQLLSFLNDALQHRQKHLLIVHGKGYHSDTDQPILKNLVNQVLRSWPNIIAFCSAKPKDGGTGATYVFLKLNN